MESHGIRLGMGCLRQGDIGLAPSHLIGHRGRCLFSNSAQFRRHQIQHVGNENRTVGGFMPTRKVVPHPMDGHGAVNQEHLKILSACFNSQSGTSRGHPNQGSTNRFSRISWPRFSFQSIHTNRDTINDLWDKHHHYVAFQGIAITSTKSGTRTTGYFYLLTESLHPPAKKTHRTHQRM